MSYRLEMEKRSAAMLEEGNIPRTSLVNVEVRPPPFPSAVCPAASLPHPQTREDVYPTGSLLQPKRRSLLRRILLGSALFAGFLVLLLVGDQWVIHHRRGGDSFFNRAVAAVRNMVISSSTKLEEKPVSAALLPGTTPSASTSNNCSLALTSSGCATCGTNENGDPTCLSCLPHDPPGRELKLDRERCAPVCQGQVGCLSCSSGTACNACAPDYYEYPPDSKKCVPYDQVPGPKLVKFYNYRATDGEGYAFGNCDGASALGVLGYLIHEVVGNYNGTARLPIRKFGIDRIKREVIHMYNPPAVYLGGVPTLGKSPLFGQWNPFDKAMCSTTVGPQDTGCVQRWENYGYNVGCFKRWCPTCGIPSNYYDFPGPCPEADYTQKNATCKSRSPGGQCARPNGRRDCTWNVSDAGEIMLDDLEGITPQWKDFAAFASAHQCEFDRAPPAGCHSQGLQGSGLPFWGSATLMDDPAAAKGRMEKMLQMFKAKYPESEDLEEPVCDWVGPKVPPPPPPQEESGTGASAAPKSLTA